MQVTTLTYNAAATGYPQQQPQVYYGAPQPNVVVYQQPQPQRYVQVSPANPPSIGLVIAAIGTLITLFLQENWIIISLNLILYSIALYCMYNVNLISGVVDRVSDQRNRPVGSDFRDLRCNRHEQVPADFGNCRRINMHIGGNRVLDCSRTNARA